MKKFALLLALALPMAFTSCSNDDPDTNEPLTLDKTTLTIDYGTNATLTPSEKDGVWTSSNAFVATVDAGKVTAKHVGEATIEYTKGDRKVACTVTVEATNDNFAFPCLNFGATAATVKAFMTSEYTLTGEDSESLTYVTAATNGFPIYVYSFENDALDASSITVDADMDEALDMGGWINEYFAYVDEDEDSFIFADANTLTDANIAVIYQAIASGDEELWMAIFMPVDHSKAGVANVRAIAAKHEAAVKAVVK